MKKLTITLTGGIVIILIISGLISKKLNNEIDAGLTESLPNFYISDLDSTQLALHAMKFKKGLILSFINSECEICHAQVDEFYKRAYKLDGYDIILISYQNIQDIKEFSSNYPNAPFTFWKADYQLLSNHFENFNTPQTRLYNSEMKLLHQIDGIARIAHIKRLFEN